MYEKINEEINKIISEGWTDGMSVLWGTSNVSHTIYTGTISGTESVPITENTVYDLASVTKIFFLVCVLKLVEKNSISLDACVGDYSTLFPNISNIKIFELMNFSKPLQTSRRIDSCNSYDEAVAILRDIQVMEGSPKYSDMGAIVLSFILSTIPDASFKELLSDVKEMCSLENTYIWNELPLSLFSQTQSYDNEYVLKESQIVVKHTPIGIPHDDKARILGECGHAGLFTTPYNIVSFCQSLLSGKIITKETLSLVSSSKYDTFINEQHFGLLCYKKAANEIKSEIPTNFSDAAFAISGFTGTYLLIDPEKDCFISINSNRIYNRSPRFCLQNSDIKSTQDYVYRKDAILRIIPI